MELMAERGEHEASRLMRGMPLWSLRMWRSINGQLSSLYQYGHLIFGTTGYQPSQPDQDTIQQAHELMLALETGACHESALHHEGLYRLKAILRSCSDVDALVQVPDASGYGLLQRATISDDRSVLENMIEEGCDLNKGKCTLPLHLACKLGNLELVDFLLKNGAKPNIERGMCYPKPHVPVRHVPSRFHFLETDIYTCDSNFQLPIMYAIESDHVHIVLRLVEVYNNARFTWPYHRLLLHYACKCGAYRSMQYLTGAMPHEVNEVNDEGMTTLLYAARWGKRFVRFMVEAGADIHLMTNKRQTALHLLYLNIEDPKELYETTRFLLGTGLEQQINTVDVNGNTALHALVSQVNCLVDSYPTNPSTTLSQETFDDQVLHTLDLVLTCNAEPNLLNKSGVTAMHKLLLTFDFLASNDPAGITLETLPVRERFKIDLDILHKALEILLKHGATANLPTGAGRTPLVMLVHSMLNIDTSRLHQYADSFVACITLLCNHGAMPSVNLPTHVAIVSTLCKFGQRCLQERNEVIKGQMSSFLKEVMALLLRHGLDSNHCSLQRKREVQGDSGNVLVELVKLAQFIRSPPDLLLIKDWALTALQWGANPDIEPYPSDPIICTSQSSIFLKPKGTQPVNQYMYQIQDFNRLFEGGHAEQLLLLFYNSMDHEALYNCLNTAKFMSRFDPTSTRTPSSHFLRLVTSLQTRPRSLKEMSRVAIYKAIDRQLNLRVRQLPLPSAIHDYLIRIH